MADEKVFEIYKEYLKNLAIIEGRPFKLPSTSSSLEKRSDIKLFYVLKRELEQRNITNISSFIKFSRLYLEHKFYITNILSQIDEILIYQVKTEAKPKTREQLFNDIRKSFSIIGEECLLNKIPFDDINYGNPSVVLRLWKQKKIDKVTAFFMSNIKEIKQKPWVKMYASQLLSDMYIIEKKLDSDVVLNAMMVEEKDKLEKILGFKDK